MTDAAEIKGHPKKPLIFCSAYAISVESHMGWLAARTLLDLANEEGSGSPNRIFPALICIDFKQCGLNGKHSESDFEGEVEEYLWVCGVFSTGWAAALLLHCGRSKLIPLLIKLKLDESRQGLAFVFLCAGKLYEPYV